jgi:hypothetical protein
MLVTYRLSGPSLFFAANLANSSRILSLNFKADAISTSCCLLDNLSFTFSSPRNLIRSIFLSRDLRAAI